MPTQKSGPDFAVTERDLSRDLRLDLVDCLARPETFNKGGEAHQAAIRRALDAERRLQEIADAGAAPAPQAPGVKLTLRANVEFRCHVTEDHGVLEFSREVRLPLVPAGHTYLHGFLRCSPEEADPFSADGHKFLLVGYRAMVDPAGNVTVLCTTFEQQQKGGLAAAFQPPSRLEEETVYKLFGAPWKKVRRQVCRGQNLEET